MYRAAANRVVLLAGTAVLAVLGGVLPVGADPADTGTGLDPETSTSTTAPPSRAVVDLTSWSGLNPMGPTESYGVVTGDFDADGRDDAFVNYHDEGAGLFRRIGQAGFARVHEPVWPPRTATRWVDRHGCTWGDADGDGRADLFCAVGRSLSLEAKGDWQDNELWLQDSGGGFTDVGTRWGLGDPYGRGRTGVFLDANGDGCADLYTTNELPQSGDPNTALGTNKLFVNRCGGAGFTRDPAAGLDVHLGHGRCVAALDIEGDGDDDLLVCGETSTHLYRNDGGSFTDVASQWGITHRIGDFAITDVDRDGRPDVLEMQWGSLLYQRNTGTGFAPPVRMTWITGSAAQQVALGDADLDGNLDIYVVRANTTTDFTDVIYTTNAWNGAAWTIEREWTVPVMAGVGEDVASLLLDDGRAAFVVTNGREDARGATRLLTMTGGTATPGTTTTTTTTTAEPPTSTTTAEPPTTTTTATTTTSTTAPSPAGVQDLTGSSGLNPGGPTESYGATTGDYDGDGRDDVFVGFSDKGGALFRRTGSTRFTKANGGLWPAKSGAARVDRRACAWGDANGDGRPDLYCAVDRPSPSRLKGTSQDNELWLQDASGGFAESGTAWGVGDRHGRGRAAVFFHANGDGCADLYVTNESPVPDDPYRAQATNKLFLNRCGGLGFTRATAAGLDVHIGHGRCLSALDIDKDGDQDLLVCGGSATRLYRNDAGRFTDVAGTWGVSGRLVDVAVADVDSDGRTDVVGLHGNAVRYQRNTGTGFTPMARLSWVAGSAAQRMALGDADRDGSVDVYVVRSNGTSDFADVLYTTTWNGTAWTVKKEWAVPAMAGLGEAVASTRLDDGRSAFVVTNGRNDRRGQTRLIVLG